MNSQTGTSAPRRAIAAITVAVIVALAASGAASGGSDRSSDPVIGFVLDRGRVEKLDLPGTGTATHLAGISNRGRIVGKYPDADGKGFHGLFVDRRGGFRRIDFPGAMATYANKIDERGRIVGAANRRSPDVGVPGTFGYLMDGRRFRRIAVPRAVYTQALGINNRGQVVGEYLDRRGILHGYRWKNGRFKTFNGPTGTGASISDINDRGVMVGVYAAADGRVRGFRLRKGVYRTFAAPDRPVTLALDINNRGQIAGFALAPTADDPLAGAHGFLLADGPHGAVTRIDVPGAPRTVVGGLDDRGRLVGVYENPNATPSAQDSRLRPPTLLPGQALERGAEIGKVRRRAGATELRRVPVAPPVRPRAARDLDRVGVAAFG